MTIYEAIAAVMNDCGAVGKGKFNSQQGYKYRGIDDVMNALNPAFSKHHLFCTPEVLEQTREERTSTKGNVLIYSVVRVKYTFYADDGSSVTAVVIGEGMDSGDKATNKAMSAAFKYACFQVFCIPTEEMHDSEEDSHEVMAKPKRKKAEPVSGLTSPQGGATPEQRAKIMHELNNRVGVESKSICNYYKISSLDELTEAGADDCIRLLGKYPVKKA